MTLAEFSLQKLQRYLPPEESEEKDITNTIQNLLNKTSPVWYPKKNQKGVKCKKETHSTQSDTPRCKEGCKFMCGDCVNMINVCCNECKSCMKCTLGNFNIKHWYELFKGEKPFKGVCEILVLLSLIHI